MLGTTKRCLALKEQMVETGGRPLPSPHLFEGVEGGSSNKKGEAQKLVLRGLRWMFTHSQFNQTHNHFSVHMICSLMT